MLPRVTSLHESWWCNGSGAWSSSVTLPHMQRQPLGGAWVTRKKCADCDGQTGRAWHSSLSRQGLLSRHKADCFLLIWERYDAAFYWNKQGDQLPQQSGWGRNPDREATTFLGWHVHPDEAPERQSCLGLQLHGTSRLEFPKGLRKEKGFMGANLPSLMNFLSRWLGCERKSPGWYVSIREREVDAIMQWHGQTNSTVLSPRKGKKINRLLTLWKQMVKTCRMRKPGPLLLFRAGGGAFLWDSPN